MPLSTAELTLIEQRVANDGPSTGVAYLFWFFLWFVSAHRFYLGRPGTAILQILSYFILIGFVWVLIDAFLIPGMIQERRNGIRQQIALQMGADHRAACA
jgi:TM2 domain-containing membrane protein YozV